MWAIGSVLFGAALFNALSTFAAFLDTDPYEVTTSFDSILKTFGPNSSLTTYPTDLTRNLVPKFIHSHNDYWRDIPFYSALSVGAVSIEADVWLINGTLYVGHELSALTKQRTFDALYVQPLLKHLQSMNPSTPFVQSSQTRNGAFDTDSSQTLYLWTDLKTDGPSTLNAVIKALQPLRDAGYLARAQDGKVSPGPVTVIGTGNTPLGMVQAANPRDYFSDADLANLPANVTADVSPIASTDFASAIGALRGATLNSTQLAALRKQIGDARSRGIGARYWDTPGWPTFVRNGLWKTLWQEGVMLVNVDDLVAGADYAESSNGW